MMITVLFPEFIFAHAIGELKMALDDLHNMSLKKKKGEWLSNWEVEFGVKQRLL
jgi:hypothetical protein